MYRSKSNTQVLMTISLGVDLVQVDPFDLPESSGQIALPPVEPSRAVIPVAAPAYPRYWGNEIQAEIERRFDARVCAAIGDEVAKRFDARLAALNDAIQEKIDELDCAIALHRQAESELRQRRAESSPSAMCTPSRWR